MHGEALRMRFPWQERGAPHLHRLQDLALQGFLPWLGTQLLDDRAQQAEARIRIVEASPGRVLARVRANDVRQVGS